MISQHALARTLALALELSGVRLCVAFTNRWRLLQFHYSVSVDRAVLSTMGRFMGPACDQCGYDLSATERGDAGFVCPECGRAHPSLDGLVYRPWPGWWNAVLRMCWHVPVAAGVYALWLLLLPELMYASPPLVGIVAMLVAFGAIPLFVFVGIPWGPVGVGRHLAPKAISANDPRPSRVRVIAIGLAINASVAAALWMTQNQWIMHQIVRSMGD